MRTDTEPIQPSPSEVPATRAARHRPRRKGGILRFLGRIFLTAGVLLGALIAWVLWGTGLFTAQEQSGLRQELADDIREPGRGLPELSVGSAYGVLQIPAMQLNAVVLQGTELDDLQRGPGHYVSTEDPWDESGRVGIAGHRTTYSAPFNDLDVLDRGDRITMITGRGTFYWEVTKLEIVEPSANEVLQNAPKGADVRIGEGGNDASAIGPSLVLTTCHPEFSSAQRLIAFAKMVEPPADAPAEANERNVEEVIGPGGPEIFSNGAALVRLVAITTSIAFVIGLALAVLGARTRRRARYA